ncbi:MAG TPA: hydroxyacylglutathione hydrolase [Moraxellaceae bacterium]|nr:hydroxyacylglutathione hydrolase [Moraxellaceae bacterium]
MLSFPVALPAFQDNYIWAWVRGGTALVVDPGDAAVVEDWLAASGIRLSVILVTHHHPDHIGGLDALRSRHPVRVLGPDEGIPGVDDILHGGERLDLTPFGTMEVLAVPGHTRGHIAFHFPAEALLFCGDALFSAGCGRLFEGTPAQLHDSLARLSALPPDTRFCCAHEYTEANLRFAACVEPDNGDIKARQQEVARLRAKGLPTLPARLGDERLFNPFLRCEEPAVVDAASREAGSPLAPGLPVLAALRAWKDYFPSR